MIILSLHSKMKRTTLFDFWRKNDDATALKLSKQVQ